MSYEIAVTQLKENLVANLRSICGNVFRIIGLKLMIGKSIKITKAFLDGLGY